MSQFPDAWRDEHDFIRDLRETVAERADFDTQARTNLYFVQDETGPIKIGVAVDPWNRFKNLQVANPRELRLLAIVPATAGLERLLHRILARDRIRGEWFRPSPQVMALVEEYVAVAQMCEDIAVELGDVDHIDARAIFVDVPPTRELVTPAELRYDA